MKEDWFHRQMHDPEFRKAYAKEAARDATGHDDPDDSAPCDCSLCESVASAIEAAEGRGYRRGTHGQGEP